MHNKSPAIFYIYKHKNSQKTLSISQGMNKHIHMHKDIDSHIGTPGLLYLSICIYKYVSLYYFSSITLTYFHQKPHTNILKHMEVDTHIKTNCFRAKQVQT